MVLAENNNLKSWLKMREKWFSYPILLFGGCGEESKLWRGLGQVLKCLQIPKLHENYEN